MRAFPAWILPVVFLLAGSGEFDAGVRAYREGRFAEAVLAFDAAGLAAGENASPELLFNQALAAHPKKVPGVARGGADPARKEEE